LLSMSIAPEIAFTENKNPFPTVEPYQGDASWTRRELDSESLFGLDPDPGRPGKPRSSKCICIDGGHRNVQ
ncbi:MAG: hypothetical protein WBE54_17425, partial [Bradyrhizobium sp.]